MAFLAPPALPLRPAPSPSPAPAPSPLHHRPRCPHHPHHPLHHHALSRRPHTRHHRLTRAVAPPPTPAPPPGSPSHGLPDPTDSHPETAPPDMPSATSNLPAAAAAPCADADADTDTDGPGESGWCFGRQSVEDAIRDVAAGKFIVVVDDENRENEGDLILAADCATPEALAFMVRHTSGVVCVAMEGGALDRLALAPMVQHNTDPKDTAFAITCDLRAGTTTGISAADRAATLRALADPRAAAADFNRPGHIFPLRYRAGGVLKRAGHTEAAVDFARAAGRAPAGVLCEIVNDADGSMARLPQLREFARAHALTLTSIADLVRYRRLREKLVDRVGREPARMPTRYGTFDAYAFRSVVDGVEHIALVTGADRASPAAAMFSGPVLVRVHSECCTGDVFGSLRCDCGPQLDFAMSQIAAEGRGVLVYLRGQEGRGIGLAHKMRAYALQDRGRDTVEANEDLGLPVDSREYGIGAQILADLGVSELILMTNNPAKYSGLSGYGLKIVERRPVMITPNPENERYLKTKRTKLGHWLNSQGPLPQ